MTSKTTTIHKKKALASECRHRLSRADKVNVDISIKIGREQMAAFEYGWPTRLNITLTKNVTSITSTKKAVYDTELMYTR